MLMVIFGAGASYDSFAALPPPNVNESRLPLANQLFDRRFGDDYRLFPQCHPVIPLLQPKGVDTGSVDVEAVLEGLQQEASRYRLGLRQLTALRYYLGHMLWRCQEYWTTAVTKGVSNYKTLLDQIARRPVARDGVCLVTFNYDTLVDEALTSMGFKLRSISDYARNAFFLVKIHGSINWAHPIRDLHVKTNETIRDLINKIIDRAPDLDVDSDLFEIVSEDPFARPLEPLFPAVAIPVQNKPGYECPKDHLVTLEKCLPRVDKILVVGWRANDRRFLDTLAKGLPKNAGGRRVMVVSSSPQSASEINQRIRAGGVDAADYFAAKGGFSQFILSPEADEFLGH